MYRRFRFPHNPQPVYYTRTYKCVANVSARCESLIERDETEGMISSGGRGTRGVGVPTGKTGARRWDGMEVVPLPPPAPRTVESEMPIRKVYKLFW